MNSGTLSFVPICCSIRITASFAPPCSGPDNEPIAPASAEYGSACELAIARIAFVLAFCSWSACRMKSTSIARSMTGFGTYFGSTIRNSMFRKLPEYVRSLSG